MGRLIQIGSRALFRSGVRVCGAHRGGLGLAAGLGDGLGECGEQDGEPQPERDRADEAAEARQAVPEADEVCRGYLPLGYLF